MKTKDIITIIEKEYAAEKTGKGQSQKFRITLPNGDAAMVSVTSISSSRNQPCITKSGTGGWFKDDELKDMPCFILCGDNEATFIGDTAEKIAEKLAAGNNAVYNSYLKDDYILAITPLSNGTGVLASMDFDSLVNQISSVNYAAGIYSSKCIGEKTKYYMTLIRVKENGADRRQYLDAYFASANSRAFLSKDLT